MNGGACAATGTAVGDRKVKFAAGSVRFVFVSLARE